MRIKILFTKNIENVPNNLNIVNSYIHNCLGRNNNYHDNKSSYSISRLLGGNIIENGKYFDYPNGGYILVTSFDMEFINKIIIGVINNDLGYGMNFNGIEHIQEKFYNGWNNFRTTKMGFLLKKPNDYIYDKNDRHKGYYTLNDSDITEVLTNQIKNKFSKINPKFDFTDFKIELLKKESNTIEYRYSKHVKNTVNICQINVFTNKKVAEAIYNYGIGQSTGSGFGTVYTTNFINQY